MCFKTAATSQDTRSASQPGTACSVFFSVGSVVWHSVDLHRLFGDPCRGVRKELSISYLSRGFAGCVRVAAKAGYVTANITLGFPPAMLIQELRRQARLREEEQHIQTRQTSEEHHKSVCMTDHDTCSVDPQCTNNLNKHMFA
jgi:hypothetical protein